MWKRIGLQFGAKGFITWKSLACVTALVVSSGALAQAQQRTAMGWSATSDTNMAGYILNYGTQSGNYPSQISTGTNLTTVVNNLVLGTTYYFALTTYDANGLLSAPSSEISFTPSASNSNSNSNSTHSPLSTPGQLQIKMSSGAKPYAILTFTMAPGHSYQLQGSTDLHNWSLVWQSGAVISNTVVSHPDNCGFSYQQRFYRYIQQ